MICINCFHEKTKIVNSRQNKKYPIVWRRHYCLNCQQSFTTYEQPANETLQVTDNSLKTPFNFGKLIVSIAKSFQHDEDKADIYSYDLAITIRQKLTKKTIITNQELASLCLSTLEAFDYIAALQYAAQHRLIVDRKHHKGKSTFYRSDDDSDHSSRQ